MRLLFVKRSLVWPRSSGHDVHAYHMMRACIDLGHEVCLATADEPSARALEGLSLQARLGLDTPHEQPDLAVAGTMLQRRFRSYYGVPTARLRALAAGIDSLDPDVVVVVGLDGLPYFPAIAGAARVWYAADEWISHHLSQVKIGDAGFGQNCRDAVVKGLYERAHASVIDRVWVVSNREQRAMRWLAGMRHVDVVPNGVDGNAFRPGDEQTEPHTAVFWGRLDFGPNIQALEWFCRRVWPTVRQRVPDARFTIIGFHPTEPIRNLTSIDGVALIPNVEDLRPIARHHQIVMLPFISGGGIKNKLLEAAAFGLPIVCTPSAIHGLDPYRLPVAVCANTETLASALVGLWGDDRRRAEMGAAARDWVLQSHSWTAAARKALAPLEAATRSTRCGHRLPRHSVAIR